MFIQNVICIGTRLGVHCSNNKICRLFPTELGMSQYTYSGSGTHGPHITPTTWFVTSTAMELDKN